MGRSIAVAVALGILWGATRPQAQEQLFPNTKQRGRAIVEYKDDKLQMVASYEYSQRNHNLRWVLIDVAAWTDRRMILDRENIRLVTPSGSGVMVAAQRRFLEDSPQVSFVRQNAEIWRRQLNGYLSPLAPREPLKFLALPGEGIVADTALLDKDRVTRGDIYFEMPLGEWESGTYALVIDHPYVRASLPIALD